MKLKVCGMKYQDNISQVAELQPDYLGFIFYDKSPRFIDQDISKFPSNIKKTGVFVNTSISEILEKTNIYHLQAIQLHGEESPEFCLELKRCYKEVTKKSIEIIKVFSIKDNFDFSILEPYENVCNYYLFDTKGKHPGGNGYVFDWSVLKEYPSTKPYFLSGGIGVNEIEQLKVFLNSLESKYCYAIDVNSKFEIEAGLKDIEKLKEFKQNLSFRTKH
ncbi:phosphoribosylanthranilate isomerase [Flavobacteriaceae bacterium AU392]|nr:phosphoribosylanthranilate isomerase [Flavobacteriaceae bacterium]RKM82740.1 phosphoribosylanthranilate isomerase [Flavobacteriaceae bacterium AU392]